MKLVLIAITTLLAGLVQGIAGFGSGPIQMMVYPMLWPLSSAAAVSVAVSVPLNANMVYSYRKEIDWKKVIIPIIPYMIICSTAISFSRNLDQALMKRIFGIFLVVLASYYLFLSKGTKKPMTAGRTAIYITISALCDALFGIGGPLMVLYFLNKTKSQREYLGTVAAFFLLNGVYNTIYRFANGILTVSLLGYVALGIVFILAGVNIAHKVVDRMNETMLKKTTYFMIGISGLLNLVG